MKIPAVSHSRLNLAGMASGKVSGLRQLWERQLWFTHPRWFGGCGIPLNYLYMLP